MASTGGFHKHVPCKPTLIEVSAPWRGTPPVTWAPAQCGAVQGGREHLGAAEGHWVAAPAPVPPSCPSPGERQGAWAQRGDMRERGQGEKVPQGTASGQSGREDAGGCLGSLQVESCLQ